MATPRLSPLVDQHCHSVLRDDPTAESFAAYLTESDTPPAPGTAHLDSQLGFAMRRWCPPLLGLEPHCLPGHYLDRRRELGAAEVNRRLLGSTGTTDYLIDTGLDGGLLDLSGFAAAAGATVHEIARLESLAERAADTAGSAEAFADDLAGAVREAARTAVGFKSIAAYRHGLDLDPAAPSRAEVRAAAGRWLGGRSPGGRLTDPVLLRHLLWSAAETGLPLQLHTGFGDPDLRLHRCDPLLLTDFIRAVRPTGCSVVLLHGYPYLRSAGYLAHVYPHVYADIGLSLSYTGARARAVLAEALELTPFGKLLFSSDAYGLPELFVVGTELFRRGLAGLLAEWTAEGAWSAADAERVAAMAGGGNARRLYGLDD